MEGGVGEAREREGREGKRGKERENERGLAILTLLVDFFMPFFPFSFGLVKPVPVSPRGRIGFTRP